MTSEDTRLKKLKYRAWHRGFREADLILGPFAENHVASLSAAELDIFEVLLDQPDHDIYQWIVGQAPTPAEFDSEVLNRIKLFRFEAHTARGDDHGG
ncbi:succinate dehydrogenase assembly factor 2 [Phenylobacterium sp.]|uniref:FAD assembly factor SdhE n=1 Tax=Phenylobacterium sp. TaxID=1871053 RepID=UPI00286CCCC7|nr:succinate dehydrogenase assembly factor 2 [Phenylobacterium sp.]